MAFEYVNKIEIINFTKKTVDLECKACTRYLCHVQGQNETRSSSTIQKPSHYVEHDNMCVCAMAYKSCLAHVVKFSSSKLRNSPFSFVLYCSPTITYHLQISLSSWQLWLPWPWQYQPHTVDVLAVSKQAWLLRMHNFYLNP